MDERNMLYVTKLEDAYIVSRYVLREYDAEEAVALLRFVREVFAPLVEGS